MKNERTCDQVRFFFVFDRLANITNIVATTLAYVATALGRS